MTQSIQPPNIALGVVDASTGACQQTWYKFFVNLAARISGSGTITAANPSGTSFGYTAGGYGNLVVSGQINSISWTRPGASPSVVGNTNFGVSTFGFWVLPLAPGDVVELTYGGSTVPSVNFVGAS